MPEHDRDEPEPEAKRRNRGGGVYPHPHANETTTDRADIKPAPTIGPATSSSLEPGAAAVAPRGSWLKRYQLLLAVPLALVLGLLIGRPANGDGAAAKSDHSAQGEAEHSLWTCSMHPQIQLPEPGLCPICGMDLIPVSTGKKGDEPAPNQVVLSERKKALARIETVAVRRADTAVEVRLLGKLEVDETKVRTITPWVDGRIDRLFVSAIGERIKQGQVIASIYSPEVYAAQEELYQAQRQLDKLQTALPIAQEAAKAAIESARTRLSLLGVSPGEARSMTAEKARRRRNVAISSSYDGTVVEQLVHEGAYVKAGTPLYKTADLSKLWAQLDAYESDLPRITKGQKVTLKISSYPDESFEGTVAFIDPVVDPRTRTAQIRVEAPNEDGRLSPGMFADAVIHTPEGDKQDVPRLTIPDTAPLFTGTRSVVYVEVSGKDSPTYEAREVQLGPRAADRYPVIQGLKEGELVVARGAFALDSDLQIRGGRSMMSLGDDALRRARSPVPVSDDFLAGLSPVLQAYLELHTALSKDQAEPAKQAFRAVTDKALAFDPRAPEEARRLWRDLSRGLISAARGGAAGKSLDELRRSFDSLSSALIEALQRFGNPGQEPVRVAFCPMAFDNRGALWLQLGDKIENPYFGASMYRCGELRETAAPSQHLGPHAGHIKPPKPTGGAAGGHQH